MEAIKWHTFANMIFLKKYTYPLLLILAIFSLVALQLTWTYSTYQLRRQQAMAEITEAFEQAYQREQTYRVPVVDIINPGELTIQSCGTEEILIIRNCPVPDTISYNNISGHSIEKFINRVFGDLREHITPLNIHCLADLFAGMLHEKSIATSFTIERFDITTGKMLETSQLADIEQPKTKLDTVTIEISDTEAIRAVIQPISQIVLSRMVGMLTISICLTALALFCIVLLYVRRKTQPTTTATPYEPSQLQGETFTIGKYSFDPNKNELQGFGELIQLNKKENAILLALCVNRGNVVERSTLLEDNWGSSGIIYSRSLDTYLTTLRKYFKKDPLVQIVTIKGVGYKLVVNE